MRVVIINKRAIIVISIIAVILSLIITHNFKEEVLNVFSQERLLPIYSVDTEEKKIAISFDAAWGAEHTDEILNILKQNDVKTTFFLVGFWVDKHPDMVKKIHEHGHEIGNHSNTHPNMSKLSKEEITRELNTTSNKIEEIVAVRPIVFRPPFGDYNNLLISTATEWGYTTIQWDIDSLDWKELGTEHVVDRIVNNVEKGSIILFHNNAKYVTQFLPLILEELKKQEYIIVPISSLIMAENYYIDHAGKQRKKENNSN
ncbi:MAG: deacetylase [Alkaliphilus sp.]|nr:MAG: deacetylase [Alkaliphilus sp.]